MPLTIHRLRRLGEPFVAFRVPGQRDPILASSLPALADVSHSYGTAQGTLIADWRVGLRDAAETRTTPLILAALTEFREGGHIAGPSVFPYLVDAAIVLGEVATVRSILETSVGSLPLREWSLTDFIYDDEELGDRRYISRVLAAATCAGLNLSELRDDDHSLLRIVADFFDYETVSSMIAAGVSSAALSHAARMLLRGDDGDRSARDLVGHYYGGFVDHLRCASLSGITFLPTTVCTKKVKVRVILDLGGGDWILLRSFSFYGTFGVLDFAVLFGDSESVSHFASAGCELTPHGIDMFCHIIQSFRQQVATCVKILIVGAERTGAEEGNLFIDAVLLGVRLQLDRPLAATAKRMAVPLVLAFFRQGLILGPCIVKLICMFAAQPPRFVRIDDLARLQAAAVATRTPTPSLREISWDEDRGIWVLEDEDRGIWVYDFMANTFEEDVLRIFVSEDRRGAYVS